MLRGNTLALFTVLAIPSQGQSWCPPGAMWTYTFSNGWTTEGFARFAYTGDTIIAADTCQLISAHYEGYDFLSEQPFSMDAAPTITKVTGDLVSILTTIGFDTLYHFGTGPGEGWEISMEDGSQGFGSVLITDTGTTVIDGVPLRYLVSGTDTMVERLGSLVHFMLPWVGFLIDAPGGQLRCYEDTGIVYNGPWWGFGCESWLGVGPAQARATLLLFPNPGTDHLTIVRPRPGIPVMLLLLDALGREALRTGSLPERAELDVAHVARGSYAWRLLDGQGAPVGQGHWSKQ